MTTHLLIVLLATIAAATYLGSRIISLIPLPVDIDPWQDDSSDVEEAHDEQDGDDDGDAVMCGSMAEARALVAAHRQPGDEVVIHEAGCGGDEDGDGCDCEPDEFTVGEKAEA